MGNNLFHFATGELSQDAFICWCLNWFNDNSRPRLHEMAISLIKRMADIVDVQTVDIVRQYSEKVKMDDGNTITVKVDVLAIINQNIGLIIEDKTFTAVHDNQIYRYVEGIKQILKQNGELNNVKCSSKLDSEKIRTVFWKTGFHYDYDQVVTADVKLGGPEILQILSPYRRESEILDDYLDNLKQNLLWYEKNGDFTIPYNIERWQYPQYLLMRTIFPTEMWVKVPDTQWEPYQVYHGSSYGRPWTEMAVYYGNYPETQDKWELFWRIDTDKNGPYVSLRFYESGLKEGNKERHKRKYDDFIECMKQVFIENQQISLTWDSVYPGYRGNYKEASIFHLPLYDKYLSDWQNQKDTLIATLRTVNNAFLQKIATIESNNQ